MLKFERIFYPEIHSSVNIQEEGSMEIENRFSLNVNFDNKNRKCISTFEIQSVCKAHEDWFNVVVKIVGIFSQFLLKKKGEYANIMKYNHKSYTERNCKWTLQDLQKKANCLFLLRFISFVLLT